MWVLFASQIIASLSHLLVPFTHGDDDDGDATSIALNNNSSLALVGYVNHRCGGPKPLSPGLLVQGCAQRLGSGLAAW